MPKTNITQYSSTPSENTDIDDINIDELCPASNLNNALRSLLSHLKNVDTGSQALTALSVTGALSCGAFTSNGIDDNADAVAIYIDSSERVGIGTSSLDGKLNVVTNNTNDDGIYLTADGTSFGYASNIYFNSKLTVSGSIGVAAKIRAALESSNNAGLQFFTTSSGTNSERLRIDSAGNVLVAKSSSGQVLTQGVELSNAGGVFSTTANATDSSYFVNKDTSGTRFLIRFYAGSSHVGSITSNGSSTTYATSSDYRLKENITTSWDATTRLKQLKPCRFNFISDETNTLVDGFLAHEVQSVVPEAITGTHNEVDADGNPVYQSIDQSKIIPLLVKTIQELEARITALENA